MGVVYGALERHSFSLFLENKAELKKEVQIKAT